MAKKNKDLGLVEEHKPLMPSDNIVEPERPDYWPLTKEALPPSSDDRNMAKVSLEGLTYVQATTIPEKPKVDVNKVLFEMIALLGTVDVFESQARIMRAVAAYYNLTEDMS